MGHCDILGSEGGGAVKDQLPVWVREMQREFENVPQVEGVTSGGRSIFTDEVTPEARRERSQAFLAQFLARPVPSAV